MRWWIQSRRARFNVSKCSICAKQLRIPNHHYFILNILPYYMLIINLLYWPCFIADINKLGRISLRLYSIRIYHRVFFSPQEERLTHSIVLANFRFGQNHHLLSLSIKTANRYFNLSVRHSKVIVILRCHRVVELPLIWSWLVILTQCVTSVVINIISWLITC